MSTDVGGWSEKGKIMSKQLLNAPSKEILERIKYPTSSITLFSFSSKLNLFPKFQNQTLYLQAAQGTTKLPEVKIEKKRIDSNFFRTLTVLQSLEPHAYTISHQKFLTFSECYGIQPRAKQKLLRCVMLAQNNPILLHEIGNEHSCMQLYKI